MKYSFDVGPEGWCSYDYHGCVRAGRNIFILAVWQRSGGVDDGGYIWSDEHGWSADTPENPISVFPFTLKRNWIGYGPIDLRNAEVSVYLRGDGLQLHGGTVLLPYTEQRNELALQQPSSGDRRRQMAIAAQQVHSQRRRVPLASGLGFGPVKGPRRRRSARGVHQLRRQARGIHVCALRQDRDGRA